MPRRIHAVAILIGSLAGCAAVCGAAHAADMGNHTTVGGVGWLDLSHITQETAGAEVAPTGTGFDVKRFYLVFDHEFNDVWSAHATTDAQYASTVGDTQMFVKKLYLQGKFNDAFVIRAGSADTPWIPLINELYGYRYVEKTVISRLGFGSSADWGLNATGSLDDHVVNYSVSVVNGGGYKHPSRSNTVDFEGRVSVVPSPWLTLGVGLYSGHLAQITQANSNYARNTATRWDLAGNVKAAGWNVGIEYFDARNFRTANVITGVLSGPAGVVVATTATGTAVTDAANGVSSWASYIFNDNWSIFGRYDAVRLSRDVVSNLTDTYYNAGVACKPVKPIDIALVYKVEQVDHGNVGSIGGTNVLNGGSYREFGVFAQYRF